MVLTNRWKCGGVCVALVVFLTTLSSPALAESPEVIVTLDGTTECAKITFEGGEMGEFIDSADPALDATADLHLHDFVMVQNTFYTNQPSGTAAALWVVDNAEVRLDTPAHRVSLFYASADRITVEAQDASGNRLAIFTGMGFGHFNTWFPLVLDAGTDRIARVVITGVSTMSIIDDLTVCRHVTPEAAVEAIIDVVQEAELPAGVETGLESKLEGAIDKIEADKLTPAVNKLTAFINQVKAQRDKSIPAALADQLIAWAESVIADLQE